jgi:hypothetical protein
MPYTRLPESHLTLYSELVDQAIGVAATESARGVVRGSFISKEIKGGTYWYLQRSFGESKNQSYLGPDSPALRRWMEQTRVSTSESEADRTNLGRIAKMLIAGGAHHEPAATLKAVRLLADSRVFQLGGVLVGTLAFRTYANALGVKFEKSALQTQDLDIAHDPAIGVALARQTEPVKLEELIASSGLNLHPVPPLDPKRPSTSFKVRGRELRIDLLTPMRGRESHEPVFLPAFGLSAQPLRNLDYLLEPVIQAVAVGADPVLVNLPDPARFALHKLWTSRRRSAGFQAKARKDVLQAEQLIEVLLDDRPDDLVDAWTSLPGDKAHGNVKTAVSALAPSISDRLSNLLNLTNS